MQTTTRKKGGNKSQSSRGVRAHTKTTQRNDFERVHAGPQLLHFRTDLIVSLKFWVLSFTEPFPSFGHSALLFGLHFFFSSVLFVWVSGFLDLFPALLGSSHRFRACHSVQGSSVCCFCSPSCRTLQADLVLSLLRRTPTFSCTFRGHTHKRGHSAKSVLTNAVSHNAKITATNTKRLTAQTQTGGENGINKSNQRKLNRACSVFFFVPHSSSRRQIVFVRKVNVAVRTIAKAAKAKTQQRSAPTLEPLF